ncbi:MAG: ammonium transporter [Steroidobacteraceae bacterium]
MLLATGLLPAFAHAASAPIDSGDTAWMITATALVLFMTLPGLAAFYSGLVRDKNVLSVLMQCFAITCVVSLLWVIGAYSLAFSDGGSIQGFIGSLDKAFFASVTRDSVNGTIPESVFSMFQLTFAIITPALVIGGFAERIRFSAVIGFTVLWFLFVYVPVTHWVWGGGWLAKLGVLDYAGGIVVHVNAGVAALVAALVVGRRRGFPETAMAPHSLPLTVLGAGMLWVGWFGFNAGSALAANGNAGMALLVTHLGAAAGAFTWMMMEWVKYGKPSVLGIVTGMVAGLGTITPASGFAGPLGGIVIGGVAGVVCFGATQLLKRKLHIDDSLDVSPVHGVGGVLGSLLTGVFVDASLGGAGFADGMTMARQVGVQALAIAATAAWCGVLTFVILKVLAATTGLRVDAEQESEGLDLASHGERGYSP